MGVKSCTGASTKRIILLSYHERKQPGRKFENNKDGKSTRDYCNFQAQESRGWWKTAKQTKGKGVITSKTQSFKGAQYPQNNMGLSVLGALDGVMTYGEKKSKYE